MKKNPVLVYRHT